VITVSKRAHRHEDRAGDPLDGLVNLFDVGIVLSVAFLIAALSSLHLTKSFTHDGLKPDKPITVPSNAPVSPVPTNGQKVIGQGTRAGTVYRLKDGSLVYVVDGQTSPLPTPSPNQTPTPGSSPTP
jgi:hypothetical protein